MARMPTLQTFAPHISTVVETIQASLAPVFLLTGIGSLLNVLTGRLARVVDRARALEDLHPRTQGPEHDRHVWELRLLDKRMTVINGALYLAVTCAAIICLIVALLFVAELVNLHIGRIVAFAFIAAMLILVASLVMLTIEVHISLQAIHVRREFLEDRR
jgi:hypothetical protein